VRERLRLREGSELELEERADGLTLRPVEQRPSMVRESGIWVHLGKVPRGFDLDVAVDVIREERIKDTSGMKIYFDTAVLLAASVSDHPHHSQANSSLEDGSQ
jgi:hypothetical protein